MIDRKLLIRLTTKNQTTFRNTLREYCQNLFLSYFYQTKQSETFFFKGGTALRIVFQSPRFSEDLDFSTTCSFTVFENNLEKVLISIQKEGAETRIIESKKTTGGFFSIISVRIYNEIVEIQIQASKRRNSQIKGETTVIVSDFLPAYPLQILEKQALFSEKIEAFLTRRKIRDFFDLYFILRSNVQLPILHDKKKEVISIIKAQTKGFVELKEFLPQNFWMIIKELKKNLLFELQRHNY